MVRPHSRLKTLSWMAAAVLAVACGGDGGGPSGLDPNVFELAVVSGGGQSGLAGTVLENPLVVQVRRIDTGSPEEGATVRWSVISGSGEPTRTSSASDETGHAATRVVLGGAAGEVVVRAEVAGLQPVDFAPLTVLPAPSLRSVSPLSADPGDTVEVRVDDLPSGMAAQVLFDGVAGQVVARVDGTPAVLSAIVPAPAGVCAASVRPVDVRLRVNGVTTGPISISVSVPQDPFQVGQVLVIEGTTDVQCALLPADSGTAKYLLVALSTEFGQAGQFQVTLGGSSVTFAGAGAGRRVPGGDFESRLRHMTQQLAERGLPPAKPPAGAQLFAGPQVGDTRQFWVLNDINVSTIDDLTEDKFDRVTATLKFVGANVLLYQDNRAPDPGLTPADIEFLGEIYDRVLYGVDVDFFGEPSDFDGNDHVIILVTPTVNALTERGSKTFIIGFTYSLDLIDPNFPGCPQCRFSNGGELFYGVVPDPNAQFSDARTRDRVLQVLPGTMVHETQHMIDFRYKLFESITPTAEALWLSEGLAHMAEELGGDAADAAGDPDLSNDLYLENFRRAAHYLSMPDSFSLTATSGQGSIGERGAWWLFLRWLAEQYGDFVFRGLTQSPDTGVSNVVNQTGESFFRLFADWTVALWADDLTIPGLAERYQVPKWQLRSILLVDSAGGGNAVYALQPRRESFASFRSSSISKFLAGASPFYIELDAAGDTIPLQLDLTTSTSAGLAILRYE